MKIHEKHEKTGLLIAPASSSSAAPNTLRSDIVGQGPVSCEKGSELQGPTKTHAPKLEKDKAFKTCFLMFHTFSVGFTSFSM